MLNHLNYAWRLIGTGIAFPYVFLGGFLLATLLRILSFLFGPSRERAQFLVNKFFRFYIFSLRISGLAGFEIHKKKNLKNAAGKMVIANHPSLLDVVMLMALIPRAQCIVKGDLWRHWLLGAMMREAGYIKNDLEPEELIAKCGEALAEGRCLIIFPEGTRTIPGRKPNFQRGFANIAALTRASVIPAVITCSPPTLLKGQPWWHIPKSKPNFVITVEETLDAESYLLYRHNSLNSRGLVKMMQKFYEEKLVNEQS